MKKDLSNLSKEELEKYIKKLRGKGNICMLTGKTLFILGLCSLIFSLLLNTAIVPLLISLSITGAGIYAAWGICVSGVNCSKKADALQKNLNENNKEQNVQLAMDDVLKETYKPTLVKKSKTKKVIKEHNDDLSL